MPNFVVAMNTLNSPFINSTNCMCISNCLHSDRMILASIRFTVVQYDSRLLDVTEKLNNHLKALSPVLYPVFDHCLCGRVLSITRTMMSTAIVHETEKFSNFTK